jgi:outer membrane protein W
MRRFPGTAVNLFCIAAAVLVALGAAPASASAQSMVNFSFGGFVPNGNQASNGLVTDRTGNDGTDVLVNDSAFLDFSLKDFNGPTFGAEYLVAIGDNFDAGAGISFYQRTVVSADAFNEFEGTGNPILADLKLRIVPITATFRWLPIGHRNGFVPYVGAGVGVFVWRYSEIGDFVSSDNVTIVSGNFSGSGAKAGPVVLGGVRVPVGAWSVGGEVKWQHAVADLPTDQGFATGPTSSIPRIDLGGWNYSITFGVRF